MRLYIKLVFCNLTLSEYLISTLLNPRWTPRHTHRPRKRKIDPKLPLLLSPVVRLITPLVILSGYTAPPPLIPFNSNFSELDGRRLARLFCFFLNFSYIFAEYSDSYIVNICGILIFTIAIIQWRIRLSQFLWEFVFLISIRVNFCDCVMWIISFHGITGLFRCVREGFYQSTWCAAMSFGSYATSSGNSTLHWRLHYWMSSFCFHQHLFS